MDDEQTTLQAVIQARIEKTGTSAAEVARRAGLEPHAVRNILRGHPPKIHTAEVVCKALDLSLTITPTPPRGGESTPGLPVYEPRRLPTLLRDHLAKTGMSATTASRKAGVTPYAVANVLKGDTPSYQTVEAVCKVLDLSISIAPTTPEDQSPPRGADEAPTPSTEAPKSTEPTAAGTSTTRPAAGKPKPKHQPKPEPLSRFTDAYQLEIISYDDPEEGRYLKRRTLGTAPAPIGLDDNHAFYVIAPDRRLDPGDISLLDYCLITPLAQITPGKRAWFRLADGSEVLRWIINWWTDGWGGASWEPRTKRHERPSLRPEQLRRNQIVERGPITAVYRSRPSVKHPPVKALPWPYDGNVPPIELPDPME
ncbi:MAG: helix-turn-helix transcriptional regulator [Acidimicrobiaceae bacterium]|nr:helix-turn-helix transcriptional regulator [Acidimicrobiaceae bacterium]